MASAVNAATEMVSNTRKHPRAGNIVNPAKLSGRLRDSVCEQCHLAGEVRLSLPGKKLEDFRPGMELANFLQVFVRRRFQTGRTSEWTCRGAGQSRCRIASGEKLWCGTCHDPHAATVSYRERCLAVSSAAQCPSPSAERGECVECHMPKARAFDGGHTVFTDHSISRRPANRSDRVPMKELRPCVAGPQTKGMADRNLGVAYSDLGQLEQSWKYLRAAVKAGARDPALYARVAAMLQADGRYEQAEVYYRESLAMDGDQLGAVAGLASLLERAGRKNEAEEFRRRAITLCPRQVTKYQRAATAISK